MAEPLIFINTYRIKPGQLEAYREATPEWLEFLETNHPRLLHFGAYVDGDGTGATVVQVHPDAASMETQMQLIADRVFEWQEYIEWEGMDIVTCGTPGDDLLERMRQIAGSGVTVTIKTPVGSFNRFPDT